MPTSRQQGIVNALASRAYTVGMCAQWTRLMFGIDALGDFDRDGDADAVDMWKACRTKNLGDRNPPAGVPVFWSGGSSGHGHAGVTVPGPPGTVRSIDMSEDGRHYQPGNVATTTIADIEREMGLRYLGWTYDLYGHEIPDEEAEAAARDRKALRRALKHARIALRKAEHTARDAGHRPMSKRLASWRDKVKEMRKRVQR